VTNKLIKLCSNSVTASSDPDGRCWTDLASLHGVGEWIHVGDGLDFPYRDQNEQM